MICPTCGSDLRTAPVGDGATVRISLRSGGATMFPAQESGLPGLVVTLNGRSWQLTHLASGCRVGGRRSWPSAQAAVDEARAVAAAVDWTQPREALRSDPAAVAASRQLEEGVVG